MIKKFFVAAMALVIAVGFASCSKDDAATPENKQVTFNYTVAGKPSLDGTRALKSAWAVGDQIAVCFYNNSKWHTDDLLIIEYTNSGWTTKATPNTADTDWSLENVLEANCVWQAIHYRRADATKNIYMTEQSLSRSYFKNIAGGEVLYKSGSYTIDGTTIDVGEIAMAFQSSLCLVTVPGLDAADGWRMGFMQSVPAEGTKQIYENGTFDDHIVPVVEKRSVSTYSSNLLLEVGNLSTSFLATRDHSLATGVQNGDDVTFGFFPDGFKGDTYVFYLTKGPNEEDAHYVYSVTKTEEKTLEGGKAYLLPAITETDKWTATTAYLYYEAY